MRSEGDRTLKIYAVVFFGICFFAASVAAEDYPIKISDRLTLHTGDIITLQSDEDTYLKRYEWGPDQCKTPDAVVLSKIKTPSEYSYFVVETAPNNTIALRADNGQYLAYYETNEVNKCHDLSSYICVDGKKPNPVYSWFKVITIPNEINTIALLVPSRGLFLKRFCCYDIEEEGDSIILPEKPLSIGLTPYNMFTITRTGVHPDYVQSVSNITFDISPNSVSNKPKLLAQTQYINAGTGKILADVSFDEKVTTTDKWTWGRDIELSVGTTFSAKLEIPEVGSIGRDISTEIKTTEKNSREYTGETTTTIGYKQTVEIPGNTKTTAKLIVNMNVIDVDYTGLVTVKSERDGSTYQYPINGTYIGTQVLTVYVDKTEEPLNVSRKCDNQATLDGVNLSFQLGQAYNNAVQGRDIPVFNAIVDQWNAWVVKTYGNNTSLIKGKMTIPIDLQSPYTTIRNNNTTVIDQT